MIELNMPKWTRPELPYDSFEQVPNISSIENSPTISQTQLQLAKVYSSREEYSKSLPKGMRYLEIGVAWGYSAEMFIRQADASMADLLDIYNQDLKCWSWRKFGECKCDGFKHELLYTPETHEEYIKNLFSWHPNVNTIKGNAVEILPSITKEYDFIYIDISNDRIITRETLRLAQNLVPVGGIIGLNDYLIYDGIIEDEAYGTFQTVNEFLHRNKNWSVDAIALHPVGFYDIYIRKNA
jgi:hypothetical protein